MRYAPKFIEDRIASGDVAGSFPGAVLLADIIGFTSRFDQMSDLGAEGAELISTEVSNTLSQVVNACAGFNGFPVSFAGDAVTVVFPGGVSDVDKAIEVIKLFDRDRFLPLRTSIGEGEISWDAISMDGWTFYSFQGSAISRSAVNIHPNLPDEFYSLVSENTIISTDSTVSPVACFNPPDLFGETIENEFRQVVSLFLSLENRSGNDCPRSFQELVLEIAGELGGYVSGLEAGNNNYHILVVFGAPISREDDTRRADLFLQQVFARANGRVRVGAANGLVFSGLLRTPLLESYTVLGPSVNLAARMHNSANWNSVYSDAVFDRTSQLFHRSERSITLKGISSPVRAFVLSPWKKRVVSVDRIPPLIEREDVLARLETGLKQNNSQIQLTGITGMGKTRIVTELIQRMQDVFVISIRCEDMSGAGSDIFSRWLGELLKLDAGEGGLAVFREKLYSFIDQLDELEDPAAGDVSDELLRGESVLAAVVGLFWEKSLYQGLNPQSRFQNTVSVLAAFIRGHCLLRKTVIVFDDLQWIDQDSVHLLADILEELGECKPSILLMTRPGADGLVRDIGLAPVQMELSPLSQAGCRSFLEWSLGIEPSEELLRWMHHRTDGIPFFLEQYAMMLTSSAKPPDKENFPGNIHALLVARLDRLEFNLREAVLSGSVLGRVFDPRILRQVMSEDDLLDIFHSGVVERVWERTADGMYSFVHVLLREAAYNLQLHSERRRIHLKTADEMKNLWGSSPEKAHSIAFHLEMADSIDEAAVWYMKAGRHSFSRRMVVTCIEQMRRILALSKDIPSRIDAYRMIFDLHASSGNWEEAEDMIQLVSSETLTPIQKSKVQLMQANLATNQGKPNDASVYVEGLEELNPGLRPQILHLRGRILMLQAKTEEAMEHLLAVYKELKRGSDEEQLIAIKALGNASGCMLRLQRYSEAEEALKHVLSFATETGDLIVETIAVGNLALVYKYLPGKQSASVLMTRRHLELARRTGSRLLELQALGNLGSLLGRINSSPEVFELLNKAESLSRKFGGSEALSISLADLAREFRRVGKLEKALDFYRQAFQVCEDEGLGVYQIDYSFEIAHLLLAIGRIDEAEEQIAKIAELEIAHTRRQNLLWCRAILLRLQNKSDTAEKLLRKELDKKSDDKSRFDLLLELYLCSDNNEILSECIELGEKIQLGMPSWDFRNKLDELKGLYPTTEI